ncbi:MAG: hypothetical protein FJZ58_01425 [Chlamydiae bacterium]|nr:hypothetical protein [Chlamydiota bacterium]
MADYLMQMLEQFIQALLSAARLRKSGAYQQSEEVISQAMGRLSGTPLDILLLYTDEQILYHFMDSFGQLEIKKCMLAADLLEELSLVRKSQGSAFERLQTLSLYLRTTAQSKHV